MSIPAYKLLTRKEELFRYNEDGQLFEVSRRRDAEGKLTRAEVTTVYLPGELSVGVRGRP